MYHRYPLRTRGPLVLGGAGVGYYVADTLADLPVLGLVEGELAYVRDTDKLFKATSATAWVEQVSGGGAASDPWSYARVAGAPATTTGQVLVDVVGLVLPLLANRRYEFEALLTVQSTSTAGNRYGVQFTGAGAVVEAQISGTLAAATSRSDRINALNTAAPAVVTVVATGAIRIHGVIVVGANPGNLSIRHLKVTSGTATVFVESFLKARTI